VPFDVGLDLAALFLRARALPAGLPERDEFDVVEGGRRYRVSGEVVGETDVRAAAGRFGAAELQVEVTRQDGGEGEPKARTMRVWVDRESRLPVRLEATASVGTLHAELWSYRRGAAEQ
jgi:hypothetical protein